MFNGLLYIPVVALTLLTEGHLPKQRGAKKKVQSVRFVVFSGPATDKILEVQIVTFVVFAGPARTKFWKSRL